MPSTTRQPLRTSCVLGLALALFGAAVPDARAIDLVPDLFKKEVINSEVWREQEQYVALAPQGDETAPPNKHPVSLDVSEVRDALKSVQLWQGGGLLRDEKSSPLLTKAQTEVLARYLAEALARAKPQEDAVFAVRGYAEIAFDTLKEREWTSGRAFFADGKLNIIIGAYQLRKDRGKRNAEAAWGVLNDYSDLKFDTGSRNSASTKMPGRVVSTTGVAVAGGAESSRPDWLLIDINKAAKAYREGLVPDEEKARDQKSQRDAARLTLERREMREEMARMRQELKALKANGGGAGASVEDRLKTLLDLKSKKLITDEEYQKRRAQILGDL